MPLGFHVITSYFHFYFKYVYKVCFALSSSNKAPQLLINLVTFFSRVGEHNSYQLISYNVNKQSDRILPNSHDCLLELYLIRSKFNQ